MGELQRLIGLLTIARLNQLYQLPVAKSIGNWEFESRVPA
jgi:hypothetical protein